MASGRLPHERFRGRGFVRIMSTSGMSFFRQLSERHRLSPLPTFCNRLRTFAIAGAPRWLCGFWALFGSTDAASAYAATLYANPANYRELRARLAPGDTLELAPGRYDYGLSLEHLNGTDAQPIVIRGPLDHTAVLRARKCCNTVQLEDTSHVTVESLTLDGHGLAGPFGVASRGATHHITLQNLLIIRHDGNQQTVGISTKGPAWSWIIRRNVVRGAGTGIYLGNSDGSAPFVAGLVEYNLISNTIGYNMEIKHQLPRPLGTGLPVGFSRTIIRHNVFSKQGATVGPDGARPNVLIGHLPLSGVGATDRYEIYGNFFFENPTEALFQGEGNIALYANLFVNSSGDAVHIQPQRDRPRAIAVFNNTVVAQGSGLCVSGGAPAFTQRVVANAVFADPALCVPDPESNVVGPYSYATDKLMVPFAPPGHLDLRPKPSQLLGPPVDPAPFANLTDGLKDFNGAVHRAEQRGAYADTRDDSWRPALTIKPGP
jgi:hypothetical protein